MSILGSLEIVRREIAGIEELLAEEPDSRCEQVKLFQILAQTTDHITIGCLDSIAYYKGVLKNLLSESGTDLLEIDRLEQERLATFRRLEQVDPMRKNRYADLGESSCVFPEIHFPHLTNEFSISLAHCASTSLIYT